VCWFTRVVRILIRVISWPIQIMGGGVCLAAVQYSGYDKVMVWLEGLRECSDLQCSERCNALGRKIVGPSILLHDSGQL
jgi:hypothetical protein